MTSYIKLIPLNHLSFMCVCGGHQLRYATEVANLGINFEASCLKLKTLTHLSYPNTHTHLYIYIYACLTSRYIYFFPCQICLYYMRNIYVSVLEGLLRQQGSKLLQEILIMSSTCCCFSTILESRLEYYDPDATNPSITTNYFVQWNNK